MGQPKLIAFDLDGTLSQHRSPIPPENRQLLDALRENYELMIVGAGSVERIFRQIEGYPIDIIGSYGMELGRFDPAAGAMKVVYREQVTCDRNSVEERAGLLRERFGYTAYEGQGVEFHPSGYITFPLLGTGAKIGDKLAFDPDRAKRSLMYPAVKELFNEYTVFIGGSSSFDIVPLPYNKRYALERYCRERGLEHDQVLFVGDDYGPGGNDRDLYLSDFPFLAVDDYKKTPEYLSALI